MIRSHVDSVRLLATSMAALVAVATTAEAGQPRAHARKPLVPAKLADGPGAACADVGDVALIVDNGLMVTAQNPFDLDGKRVRFEPAGDHAYVVSTSPGWASGWVPAATGANP